jgi:hypothetical protein
MQRMMLAILAVATAGSAVAQPAPKPLSAMPLSGILAGVEGKAGRVVFSAENHRGRWEVVSCENRRDLICREDIVDPATGAIVRSERETVFDLRPPAGAKPASEIARGIESTRLGDIIELQWDSRAWEARLRNARGRAELDIDAAGNLRRCEGPGCPPR